MNQASTKNAPPIAGEAPRRAAAALLIEVFERRKTLDDALNNCAEFSSLEGHERAFARAIAGAAIRRHGALDYVTSQFLQKPLPENAVWARAIVSIGAARRNCCCCRRPLTPPSMRR